MGGKHQKRSKTIGQTSNISVVLLCLFGVSSLCFTGVNLKGAFSCDAKMCMEKAREGEKGGNYCSTKEREVDATDGTLGGGESDLPKTFQWKSKVPPK